MHKNNKESLYEDIYFICAFIFLFLLICVFTYYKDKDGITVLGNILHSIFNFINTN